MKTLKKCRIKAKKLKKKFKKHLSEVNWKCVFQND